TPSQPDRRISNVQSRWLGQRQCILRHGWPRRHYDPKSGNPPHGAGSLGGVAIGARCIRLFTEGTVKRPALVLGIIFGIVGLAGCNEEVAQAPPPPHEL